MGSLTIPNYLLVSLLSSPRTLTHTPTHTHPHTHKPPRLNVTVAGGRRADGDGGGGGGEDGQRPGGVAQRGEGFAGPAGAGGRDEAAGAPIRARRAGPGRQRPPRPGGWGEGVDCADCVQGLNVCKGSVHCL